MKAEELLLKCEEKASAGADPIKFLFLAWQSFRGEFKEFRDFVLCNSMKEDEINKFIEICENRVNRAGALMSDIGIVLGFVVTGIAIVISFTNKNDIKFDPFLYILTSNYSTSFKFFFIILILCVPTLIALLAHYRTQLHIWSAYKEGAILQKVNKTCSTASDTQIE